MKTVVHFDPLITAKTDNLIKEPVVLWVNEFTEASVKEFSTNMAKAHTTGQPIIPIYIDSYGGEAHAVLAMISEIEHATLPVATIVVGKAMSCGAILFSFGTNGYRYMDENAIVMIHEVSNMKWGKCEELKARVKYTDHLNQHIFKKMSLNCGQAPDFMINEMGKRKNADWFLDVKECKKIKLANHAFVPKFKVSVDVNIKFE